jgi:hypothetical protein
MKTETAVTSRGFRKSAKIPQLTGAPLYRLRWSASEKILDGQLLGAHSP